ncbi:MAG: GNAT family N-acetyltransferase [bacterium]
MIRTAEKRDIDQICDIYNYYVQHSIATFDEKEMSGPEMEEYLSGIMNNYPWLVYESVGEVLGYAYVSPWKSRSAYKYSLESTIYIHPDYIRKGIGTRLYSVLISRAKELGFHALIGGISLPNPASVALHEKMGFQKIGQFCEVGFKFDKWVDVGYWELLLKEKPQIHIRK